MHDSGIKQNPISAVSGHNLQNRFISNRLPVIRNQHRRLVVGHPVYLGKYPLRFLLPVLAM